MVKIKQSRYRKALDILDLEIVNAKFMYSMWIKNDTHMSEKYLNKLEALYDLKSRYQSEIGE